MNKRRLGLQFVISLLLGAALWLFSPIVTGHLEPFDADASGYFWAGLFLSGLLGGSIYPRFFWVAPVATYLGQYLYAYAFIPGERPWILFGMVIGVFFQLPSVIGAAIPFVVLYGRKIFMKRP